MRGPQVQQPKAFLKLNSTPIGASIWIDGNDKGRITPDTISFEGEKIKSPHNYTLFLSGYRPYNKTFNFLKEAKATIDEGIVLLIPTSSKSAPRASFLAKATYAIFSRVISVPVASTPITSNSATSTISTAIISNTATSTPTSPAIPGFLALSLLAIIFFIYFLAFRNR